MQAIEVHKGMLDIKRHFSIVILGMFFYSLFFQTFHVIEHHFDELKGILHVTQNTHNGLGYLDLKFSDQKEVHCPLCKVRFSVHAMLPLSFLKALYPYTKHWFNEVLRRHYRKAFAVEPSRAPPFQ
ncbi:MAG: hypothetical protein CL843_19405 [Crocinitomicaceae bacterium]|nr:hypothetical protein [Crocinitomicaceae bacterium]